MNTKNYAQEWDFKSFKDWVRAVHDLSGPSTNDVAKGFRQACALLRVQTYYEGMLEDLQTKVRDFNLIEGASKIKRGVRMAAEYLKLNRNDK